jgi:hypothetical protein
VQAQQAHEQFKGFLLKTLKIPEKAVSSPENSVEIADAVFRAVEGELTKHRPDEAKDQAITNGKRLVAFYFVRLPDAPGMQ